PVATRPAASPSQDSALCTLHSALVREAWPLGVIALAVLMLFRDALLAGRIFYEDDTRLFYYPLMSYVAGQLKAGHFPLWNPDIFGGYPIFSDGEAGVLYPLNLVTMALLGLQASFAGLRVLHFLLAGVFAYLYGRSLRLSRPGALTVGLVFTLGGALIAQVHHANVIASAIWLPAVLACVEMALLERGRPARIGAGARGLGVGGQRALLWATLGAA